MLNNRSAIGIVCIGTMLAGSLSSAGVLQDKLWLLADNLERTQIKDDSLRNGSWVDQADYTGAIASGLAAAFQVTSEERFQTAAEQAGLHVVYRSSRGYIGDEALALANLAGASPFYPAKNFWQNVLLGFYRHILETQGIAEYVSGYDDEDSYWPLFDLANHVVAAYAVDAPGKKEWRTGLIGWIKRLDDGQAHYPVMALGIATWALAQSGPLDQTLIDPNGKGAARWRGKTLSDLPGLLLGHQVPAGVTDAGSFYWRFDHGDGGQGLVRQGYSEDAIYGTLGLWAAHIADPNSQELKVAVVAAQDAILKGIGSDGLVREHLTLGGKPYDVFAGEMAQALAALAIPHN